MKYRYFQLQSPEGQVITVDKLQARYNKISRSILNYYRLNGGYLKHIILTQREESYHPNILNYFLTKFRVSYGAKYLWVAEMQERGVLHWHMFVVFPVDTDIGPNDLERFHRWWKYGNVDVRSVRVPSVKYLMKYILKDPGDVLGFSFRRIGVSRLGSFYRLSWRRILEVLGRLGRLDWALDLVWCSSGGYGVDEWDGKRFRVFDFLDSGWKFLGVCDVPF